MNCNTPTMLRLSEIHNQTSVDNTMVILIIKYSLSLRACITRNLLGMQLHENQRNL